MKPGIELDTLIAEKIFGFKVVYKNVLRFSEDGISGDWVEEAYQIQYCFNKDLKSIPFVKGTKRANYGEDDLPKYSTDLATAFTIIDKLYFDFTLTTNTDMPSSNDDCWQCDFFAGEFKAWGSTPAHAICLAALKTKEPLNYET